MNTGLVTRYRAAVEIANICFDIQTLGQDKTLEIKLENFACVALGVMIGQRGFGPRLDWTAPRISSSKEE
jgi:hypothetical protein